MMPKFTPTIRISLGLVSLTVSLILGGFMLGLVPDESKAEIQSRARIAETLAMQLATSVARNDNITIRDTLSSVEKRNTTILSVGLRRTDGTTLFASRNHDIHWVESHNHKSTPTHVQVPLLSGDTAWGKIEIAFRPLESGDMIAGIPTKLAGLIGFLSILGMAGYYLILRRALKELDPSGVIPDRVQVAFDSLAEGVLILDEKETVLLANSSFAESIQETPSSLFGTSICDLKWRHWTDFEDDDEYPWRTTMRNKAPVTTVNMGLRTASGELRNFTVNATCIQDGKGKVSGAIATFDDVTALERKNEDLVRTVQKLESTEEEITRQNRKLQYLASHDPLSGCLNRRAFFEGFETRLARAQAGQLKLSCLMVDLDHFKNINDSFGHAVGDQVIAGVADILKTCCGEDDLAGRYGGEEFCLLFFDANSDKTRQIAEQIRQDISNGSQIWLPSGETATASIGISMNVGDYTASSAVDMVDRADQALYAAKEGGRDQVVVWDEIKQKAKPEPAKEAPLRRSSDKTGNVAVDAALELRDVDSAAMHTARPIEQSEAVSGTRTDPLTQLPAQEIFMDRVSQSIVRAERNQKQFAVLQVSIDAYERLSEIFGDAGGKKLIGVVASRLSDALRQSDAVSLVDGGQIAPSISRLAECKFAITLTDLDNIDNVTWIIKRLTDCLSDPIVINDQKIYATSSVGICVYPHDGADAETLLRHAGVAERHARENDSADSQVFFTKEMNEVSRRQLMIEVGIRQALEDDEFALFYQPIVNLQTGHPISVEALLRCTRKELQGIPIDVIISIAEQTDLMPRLGDWVLETATSQMQQWLGNGIELPKISVNISANQLRNSKAVERLMHIVGEMNLEPSKLQLEVTETALMRDIDSAGEALKRLQQLGVQIALDDFGTGHSSLTYLRRFRPDILKIDRSFINKIETSHTDVTLVSAIVAMSHQIGLRVVAEGVETNAQLDRIKELGCDEAQGYLFSKPMPTDVATDWLRLFAGKERGASVEPNQSTKVA